MKPIRRIVTLASLVLVVGSLCGCANISYLVATFAPPKKVKPLYEFPKGKKVLVFVDSDTPLSYEPVKSLLTEELNKQLVENKAVASTIPYNQMMDLMDIKTNQRMAVSDIGAKLGADLVLYVRVERFSVRDDEANPLWTGSMKATVRVVAVGNGRVWPKDQNDYFVPPVELQPVDDLSPTYGQEVAQELATKMADRIAKLFYEYTVPNIGAEHNEDAMSSHKTGSDL